MLLCFLSHTFVAGLLLPLTVPRGAVLLNLDWDFLSHIIFRLWICIVNLGVLMSRHLLAAPSTCLLWAVALSCGSISVVWSRMLQQGREN